MEFKLFYDITGILVLAGIIAAAVSLLKQPSIIAYILTGLVVGSLGYMHGTEHSALDALGQIGIALLLFMVGLELDVKRIKDLGKVALYTGLGQIIFTFAIGYFICLGLGFSSLVSLYVSTALTFSSTIIVIKLLAEKKDLQSLYGRICIGILLVQDFVAMGILLFMAGGSGSHRDVFYSLDGWQYLVTLAAKVLIILLLLLWLSKRVFPSFVNRFGKSDEMLLVFSVAWALGFAAFISSPFVGFSIEAGGFLAGLALANSHVHYEISARIKSLRDFFIIIFFIVFGTKLVFAGIVSMILPAILLSLFVLIGNPLIVMVIMGLMGYKPRTSFFASVTVAQISEFSFVVAAIGNRLGHLSDSMLGLVTLVGIVTIAGSSYMVLYSDRLYNWLAPIIQLFNFRKHSVEKGFNNLVFKNHIILIGANRLGSHLIDTLDKKKQTLVIVDFDPEIAAKLEKQGLNVICGDISDSYIQDEVGLSNAKLIVSTVPDMHDNAMLIEAVNNRSGNKRTRPKMIFVAQSEAEALLLYKKNIDYAIQPHFIGGLHLSRILQEDGGYKSLRKLKADHLKVMNA